MIFSFLVNMTRNIYKNLRQVLHIIQENGLCFEFRKCVFMADKVIYLGFKINKNDVTPAKDKI